MLSANRVVIGGELAALHSTSGLGTTPISPLFEEVDLSIFPNPISDYLTVGLIGGKPQVEIYDAAGRMFVPMWHSPQQLDLSGFRPGIYFLKIRGRNRVVLRKIMKS